jgi:hypothetical protein
VTLLLLLLALLALVVVLSRRVPAERGATVDELAEARAIVAIRLREYEAERAERFRRYEEAWRRQPSARPRGYLLPFAAGGER